VTRVLRQRPELTERAAWDGAGVVVSATMPRLVHHGALLHLMRECMHGPGQFRPLGPPPKRDNDDPPVH
jgi:hypothetical protein